MVPVPAEAPEPSRGQWLDRYELVYPLAKGGMARIWLAKLQGKHGFEKLVALKTMLPAFAEDFVFRDMFLDEAKIAAKIEHLNVAQILDLGECDRQLYLVMEWVDGDPLEVLDRAAQRAGAALPIPVLIRIMADVCAGLHAAHELCDAQGRALNVVHRDVSPQNILISSKGVAKLIDFGVAKARHRVTEETSTGTIKGKLQYMSPQPALGQTVDRRADIWAVGATLYRLLARRPVFHGKTSLHTFKRLTSRTPPEPLPPSVPWALASIVLKALSFEPERRFGTAAELAAALEALLQGPYQSTTREVAACVELYLGRQLSARREALSQALSDGGPPDGTSHHAGAAENDMARAKVVSYLQGLNKAVPSSAPRRLERESAPAPPSIDARASEAVTKTLEVGSGLVRQGGSRWSMTAAASGLVVLAAALLSNLALPRKEPRADNRFPARSSMSPPITRSSPSEAVAPPGQPAPLLSVQSLPVLVETPKAPSPAALPRATSRYVRRRSVSAAAPAPGSSMVASSRAVPTTNPAAKVIDDGF